MPRAQTRIGEVDTTFRLIGRNDRVVVDRYDDPRVDGVSCYVSRAETGGVAGSLGLATDPNRFSIACRATGPVSAARHAAEERGGVRREDEPVLQGGPGVAAATTRRSGCSCIWCGRR